MVEVLDAIAALAHVDLANRSQFRAALFATLIKRPEDQQAFAVLFDVCFPLTPAGPALGAPGGLGPDGLGVKRRLLALEGRVHLEAGQPGRRLALPEQVRFHRIQRVVGRGRTEDLPEVLVNGPVVVHHQDAAVG